MYNIWMQRKLIKNYVSRTNNYQISQVVLRIINTSLFQMKITLQNVTRENEAVMWMIVVFGIVNRQIQMKCTMLSW